MVVEDDAAIRQLIAEILREAGHEVVECASGEEALSSLDAAHPALITLDLALPSMDGLQFLQLVREQPQFREIPVVVVTAAPESLRLELLGGAHAAVGKPFRTDQLLSVVGSVLARKDTTG